MSFAGYGIYKLVKMQEEVKIDKFADDLNEDVEELWKSGTYGKQTPNPYELPKKIDFVCFVKNEYDENLELLKETENFNRTEGKYEIEHIDINAMTGGREKYCIENTEGEIEFTLIKEENNQLEIVVSLLALLELMKRKRIKVVQLSSIFEERE